MKTYYIEFIGRKVGSIGITGPRYAQVQAESETAAVLALYATYEHISISSIRVKWVTDPNPE